MGKRGRAKIRDGKADPSGKLRRRAMRTQVDEVEVFETFGGDLPAHHRSRQPELKTLRATGRTKFRHDVDSTTIVERTRPARRPV